jgi:splicing suppressor protein 51
MAAVAQQQVGNAPSAGDGTASSSGGNALPSGGNASSSSNNAASSPAQDNIEFSPGDQDTKPFTAISKNLFFHDRLESNTFQLLIDTLRTRQQDELTLDKIPMPGSIHATNEPSSEKAFRDFIMKARAVPGFLPTWWKGEISTDACVEYARENAAFSLAVAQEKQDVRKTWGDERMPVLLRMVAEKVYGNGPGGFKTDGVLDMMVAQENDAVAGAATWTVESYGLAGGS